jgi:hypothetical protein
MKRPVWAATPNFPRCFDTLDWMLNHAKPDVREGSRNALSYVRAKMCEAHVIAVDGPQVEAIPNIIPQSIGGRDVDALGEVLEPWALTMKLPFPVVFLDLGNAELTEGAALVAPSHGTVESLDTLRVRGCLLVQDAAGDNSDNLYAVPFTNSRNGQASIAAHGVGVVGGKIGAIETVCIPGLSLESELGQWSVGATFHLFERAVAVLSWLESANVEITDAPMSAKGRATAEKKGQRIALTVRVTPPKSRRQPSNPDNARNYSHRFEVRGHYMHFGEDTRIGGADPTKLSFVPGRGFVRKVWCPPHVKGPENKPLIPKVRTIERETLLTA